MRQRPRPFFVGIWLMTNFVTTYKITLNVCLDFLQAWLWWFDFLHACHDLFACNSIEVLTCSSPLLMHDFVSLHDVHSFSIVPTWITLSSISMRMTISIGIHVAVKLPVAKKLVNRIQDKILVLPMCRWLLTLKVTVEVELQWVVQSPFLLNFSTALN